MKNIKLYELEETYRNEESSLEYPTVSYTIDTDKVWYKERLIIPNQFIATYNVTSTTSTTRILGSNFTTSQVKEMYIDNVKQEQVFTEYTFNTMGEHTVKCIMNDDLSNCYGLFNGCNSLTSLDVSNFNTSAVTDMAGMFYGCSGLTSLDLSNFDTSKVTDMRYMFDGCSGLTSIDLSNFDTSNVTDMEEMFQDCNALTSLDVSNFDTSKVTDMGNMFNGCSGLTSIRFGSQADVGEVTSYYFMFYNITTTGTLYYPSAYADSWNKLLVTYQSSTDFPSTWTAVAVDYENGETVPTV